MDEKNENKTHPERKGKMSKKKEPYLKGCAAMSAFLGMIKQRPDAFDEPYLHLANAAVSDLELLSHSFQIWGKMDEAIAFFARSIGKFVREFKDVLARTKAVYNTGEESRRPSVCVTRVRTACSRPCRGVGGECR